MSPLRYASLRSLTHNAFEASPPLIYHCLRCLNTLLHTTDVRDAQNWKVFKCSELDHNLSEFQSRLQNQSNTFNDSERDGNN